MAQVLKRCGCPRSKWAKCEHSWTVRYWDGRQREKSFKRNHAEAVKFSKKIEAEKLSAHYGEPVPVTLEEYAQGWLASHTGSANTRRIYGAAFKLHINPVFGHRKLAEVAADREGVTLFLQSLTNGTADSCRAALSACLSEAVRAGRITSTRLSGLRYQKAESTGKLEFTFPTHGQLETLVAAMPAAVRPAIWLMRGCGLRRGEVLAVHSKGFKNGRLRITEQQQADSTRSPLKARKPGDYRDVPVPAYVQESVDGLGISGGYLFDMPTRTFSTHFRQAADQAGLPGFRMHDLRHCFASVALSRGVPVTDVARWLGHRNIQVTYGLYSHFIPDSWDKARAALDAEYQEWSAA
jgi:integrase